MSYNHSSARRGKPKRLLDPSTGLTAPIPPMQQNPYMYNQQIPTDNGTATEYGFNVPEQTVPSSYGFNVPPTQPFVPNDSRPEVFPSPQFATQLLAEPMVTNMAMQYGNSLVGIGKQKFERFVPVTALRYYFAVDTDYVFTKLVMLFFPFHQKDWSVKYEQDGPLQPQYEKNAPDLYIPMMAFLTYIVVAGLALGTQERFTPEQLGILASSALAWGLFELFVHALLLYVMNLDTSLRTLDMLAYSGYKYVGINTAILLSLAVGKIGYYTILVYFSISLAFFLIRSLKLRMQPENSSYTASGNKSRLNFILIVAGVQPLLMWWLSYHLV